MEPWSMPKRPLSLTLDLITRAHPDPVRDDPTAQTFLTDDELGPGLTQALARRPKAGESLWVFGYGSLIWQPEFAFTERRIGTVRGYHRRFCLLQRRFRGSVERPGLVLALDRGGLCRGVAFRLADDDPHATLLPVWRREMRGNGYLGRWVTVETDQGPVTALTFVVNRASDRYTGRLTEPEIADPSRRVPGISARAPNTCSAPPRPAPARGFWTCTCGLSRRWWPSGWRHGPLAESGFEGRALRGAGAEPRTNVGRGPTPAEGMIPSEPRISSPPPAPRPARHGAPQRSAASPDTCPAASPRPRGRRRRGAG